MTDPPRNDTDRFTPAATGPEHAAQAVFAEPWEARAFALAVTLSQGGQFSWDEFRDRLIVEIARADAAIRRDRFLSVSSTDSPPAAYYECWLVALEQMLCEKALLNGDEIEQRADAIAASPPAPTKARSRGPIRVA